MKRLLQIKYFVAVLVVLSVFGTMDASAQKKPVRKKPVLKRTTVAKKPLPPPIKYYTVAAGQKMHVRLNDSLSSKTSKVGDTFTATITEPVYSTGEGHIVIPSGSTVKGRVTAVTAAQKGGKPGTIDVTFYSVRTPNGATRSINGALTELDTKEGKSDNEGMASGDKMKHRKIIFIGGGGVGGAVLGGAIGGGKGALIGGLLGAGAGYLGEKFTKGEDVNVKSGTEFGVFFNQSATFPKYVEPVE